MNFFTNKNNIVRKIFIIILIGLILIFSIAPNYKVYADTEKIEKAADAQFDVGGTLLKQLAQLIAGISDIVMGTLNKFMLGTKGFTSVMLPKTTRNLTDTRNLTGTESWLYAGDVNDADVDFEFGTRKH